MGGALSNALVPPHLEYAIVDREFHVCEASARVQMFVEGDAIALGEDIRSLLPELFGMEEVLEMVRAGEMPFLELKGIGRSQPEGAFLYFDLYAAIYPNDPERAILFFADVSDRMNLEQTLVQATNEMNLLLGALKSAKSYIDKIITSMADALLVTDPSGRIKTVNKAAQNLFGYDREELVGETMQSLLVDPQQLARRNGDLSAEGHSDFTNKIEVACRTKMGDRAIVAFSTAAIQADLDLASEGDTSRDYVYIGRDVTQQRREQQRQALQNTVDRFLSRSPGIVELFASLLPLLAEQLHDRVRGGWDAGEMWVAESSNGDRPASMCCTHLWLQDALPGENLQKAESICVWGEGAAGQAWQRCTPVWVESEATTWETNTGRTICSIAAFAFPIQVAGEVLGIVVFRHPERQSRDRNLLQTVGAIGVQIGQYLKRRQAEEALRESEERYRDLFENASDLIQSVDARGRFLYVNRAWLETLGYTADELENLTYADIAHPDSRESCMAIFDRAFAGEKIEQMHVAFASKKRQQNSSRRQHELSFCRRQSRCRSRHFSRRDRARAGGKANSRRTGKGRAVAAQYFARLDRSSPQNRTRQHCRRLCRSHRHVRRHRRFHSARF